MNKFTKKARIMLLVSIGLTMISCEAMREFTSGFNESSGNCTRKLAQTQSYSEGEWVKGHLIKSSFSEEEKERSWDWMKEKLKYYAKNASVGRYNVTDPYTQREYQIRVYCE